jgi:protein-S-isoprenylcysteine O-methyltransferase Ste14
MAALDKKFLQKIRTRSIIPFAIVFIIFARPTFMTIAVGTAVSFVGLAIRAWASGHIRKGTRLAVSGPYAYTRNPLYLGSLVLGIGLTIASGQWWLVLLFILLFVGIYLPTMNVEAEEIQATFGDEYTAYRENVPAIIPRLTPWKRDGDETVTYDPALFWHHGEHLGSLGLAAGIGLLILKMYLF